MSNNSVVTYAGMGIIWNRMKGNGSEAKNIGWGTSATTGSLKSDVALYAPATETRVAGTSALSTTTYLGDTYLNTGTLTCLVGSKTITEASLNDTTTLSPTTSIAVSLTSGATSVSLNSASGITGNYYRQIVQEVVLVTGGANTALETITRAQLGTSAAGAAIGTITTVGGDGGAGTGGATSGQTATIGGTQGGNQFAHSDFGGIALNVNDSVLFSWKDALS